MSADAVIDYLEILGCGHIKSGNIANTTSNLRGSPSHALKCKFRFFLLMFTSIQTYLKDVIVLFTFQPGRFRDPIICRFKLTGFAIPDSGSFKLLCQNQVVIRLLMKCERNSLNVIQIYFTVPWAWQVS